MTPPSSTKLQQWGRWLAGAALFTSLAILLFAVIARGYASRLRIEGQTSQSTNTDRNLIHIPLAFSPTGDVLAVSTVSYGGNANEQPTSTIRFLGAINGAEVQPALPISKDVAVVEQADYSPDGKMLAVLRKEGHGVLQLEVFEVATRTSIAKQKITYAPYTGSGGPEGQVTFRFSPDSSFIVWSELTPEKGHFWPRSVGVWDLVARKQRFTLDKTGFPEVSPDSRLLATLDDAIPPNYSSKLLLKLWDAQSGKLERSIEIAHSGWGVWIWATFSPEGRLVAVNPTAETTEVFDTATGKPVFQLKGGSPRFLPTGNTLMLVSGFDVQFWDTTTWKLQSSQKFDNLGRYFYTGDRVTPRPIVIPNRPQAAVLSNHSQRYWRILRWLGRVCQLNTFGTGELSLIDATNETRQTIELHEIDPISTRETSYGNRTIWSPDGASVAFNHGVDVVVWDVPPRRSFVAPSIAAALVVVSTVLCLALHRRKRPSPSSPLGPQSPAPPEG